MTKKLYLLLMLFVGLAVVCNAQYVIHNVKAFTLDGGCSNFARLPFAENSFAMWGGAISDSGDLIENYVYDRGRWSSKGLGSGNLRVPTRRSFQGCVSDSILWGAAEDTLYYTTDFDSWNTIDISDSGRANEISGIYPSGRGSVAISLNTYVVESEYYDGGIRVRTVSDRRTRVIMASKDTVIRLYDSPGKQTSITTSVPTDGNTVFTSAIEFRDTSAMLVVVDRNGTAEYVHPPYPMTHRFAPSWISRNSLGDIYAAFYHVGEGRIPPFVMRYNPVSKHMSIIKDVGTNGSLSFYDGEYVYMCNGAGFYIFHGDKYAYYRLLELVPEIIYDNMAFGFASLNADTIVVSVGGIKFVHLPKSILYPAVTSVDEEVRTGLVAHSHRINVPMNIPDGALVNWTAYNEIGQVLDNGSSMSNAGSVVVSLSNVGRTQIINLVLSASGKPPITQRVFVE